MPQLHHYNHQIMINRSIQHCPAPPIHQWQNCPQRNQISSKAQSNWSNQINQSTKVYHLHQSQNTDQIQMESGSVLTSLQPTDYKTQ